jgi:hypothetical protein
MQYGKPRMKRSAAPRIVPVARLIPRVRRRHRRVARAIVDLARECLERHNDGSFEAFTAREALQCYLPETLAAYLAVPKALRHVDRGGRPNADDDLSRQLQILRSGLECLREADAELGAARMTSNGAFLNERFGLPQTGRAADRRSVLGEFVDVLEGAFRRT